MSLHWIQAILFFWLSCFNFRIVTLFTDQSGAGCRRSCLGGTRSGSLSGSVRSECDGLLVAWLCEVPGFSPFLNSWSSCCFRTISNWPISLNALQMTKWLICRSQLMANCTTFTKIFTNYTTCTFSIQWFLIPLHVDNSQLNHHIFSIQLSQVKFC